PVESLNAQRQEACERAKCETATNQPKVSSGGISAFFDTRNEHAHRGPNLVVGEALTGGSALSLSNNSGLSAGLFPKASCSDVGQRSCNKVHEGNQDLHTLTIPYAEIRVLSNQTVIALERQD